jgi:hypothetical protein
VQIPFGINSYRHTSLPLSAQDLVNCYLEPAPPNAKTLAAVIASYGVDTLAAIGSGSLRGGAFIRGILYIVSGTTLYRVSALGVATSLGTIPGAGFVRIVGDENNVAVGTFPDVYYWDGSSVRRVTDTDFDGATWLDYFDGYYIAINPGTGRFQISDNRAPGVWNALDFASAERNPDDLVTSIVDKGELILFGRESGEGRYNSGDADFPLTKISNADFEIGCTCPRGPQKAGNTVFFPGSDLKVYQLEGYTPKVVSTPAIEQAMERATDQNFIGYSWKEAGHAFYGLKSADFAFAYDLSTNLWHKRESYGYDSWRWHSVFQAYNRWLVLDEQSNSIGNLSADVFTEFGATMRWIATGPSLGEDNKRVAIPRLELIFEQGVGLTTGQGSDPQAMLQWSGDGGRTWTNERWRSLGAIGEYRRRAVWNRNGTWRDPIARVTMSDPVRRNLIMATAERQVLGY